MPLSESDIVSHLDRLWSVLPELRQQTASRELPNARNDRLVHLAIAAYSLHCAADSWGQEEAHFVLLRCNEAAEQGDRWSEFVGLASGYLLGLHQAGLCDQTDCFRFEALLPGYMWLHSERFSVEQAD